MTEEKVITIRESPMHNYSDVINKITQGKITKLARRQRYENGIYRLKREISTKHFKLLDERVEITNSKRILWMKLTNQEAKEILGTNNEPIFSNYLTDLRRMWSRSFMAFSNVNYIFIHEIKYIRKPIQTKLEI